MRPVSSDSPAVDGRVLAIGAYFGQAGDRLARRLLQKRLRDGGWNCDAPRCQRSSFHTTICVLEGLLEYERAKGPVPGVTRARLRGEEYLLERRLFRSRSTGAIVTFDRKLQKPAASNGASFGFRVCLRCGRDAAAYNEVSPSRRLSVARRFEAKLRWSPHSVLPLT